MPLGCSGSQLLGGHWMETVTHGPAPTVLLSGSTAEFSPSAYNPPVPRYLQLPIHGPRWLSRGCSIWLMVTLDQATLQ